MDPAILITTYLNWGEPTAAEQKALPGKAVVLPALPERQEPIQLATDGSILYRAIKSPS